MNKLLTKVGNILMLLFAIGISNGMEGQIGNFGQNEIADLKKDAREKFIKQFCFASKNLLSTLGTGKGSKIIDTKTFEHELSKRQKALEEDKLESLKIYPLTEIPVDIKNTFSVGVLIGRLKDVAKEYRIKTQCRKSTIDTINNLKNDNEYINFKYCNPKIETLALINLQEFINRHTKELNKTNWYINPDYHTYYPTLSFVSVPRLINPYKEIIYEDELSLLMTGIEMDLRGAPYLRNVDVPFNTRLLFNYFYSYIYKKDKNSIGSNNMQVKIAAYQKYLTKEQNEVLKTQLLSVFLMRPQMYNCLRYMELFAEQLFLNISYKHIINALNNNNWTAQQILQHFLHNELLLNKDYDDTINNFTYGLLTVPIIHNNQQTTLSDICFKQINVLLRKPILEIVKSIRCQHRKLENKQQKKSNDRNKLNKKSHVRFKDIKINKPPKPRFVKFIKSMSQGSSGVLGKTMDFLDLKEINTLRKTFFYTPSSSKQK